MNKNQKKFTNMILILETKKKELSSLYKRDSCYLVHFINKYEANMN